MSKIEIKFQKSATYFHYSKIWQKINKESNLENFLFSRMYKKAFSLWKKNEEKKEFFEAILHDSIKHHRFLEAENNKIEKEFKNQQKEIDDWKNKILKTDKKIKETRPTIYFFSAMFSLFLTMITTITIKIKILNFDKFVWWQTMLIFIGIIVTIFFFAMAFYLIAWYFIQRHWKNLDL